MTATTGVTAPSGPPAAQSVNDATRRNFLSSGRMTNRQSRCYFIQGLAHAGRFRYEQATAAL